MAEKTRMAAADRPGTPIAQDRGIDESVARRNADRSQADTARTGVEARLQAQREGRHIQATDANGKPYGEDVDLDRLADGIANVGADRNTL